MSRVTAVSILVTALSFLVVVPSWAQSTCTADSDRCEQAHTSVVAIAHSYTAPETTVLFRVKVAAWSPGRKWGDGGNGFFYRVTATHVSGATTVSDYVPFNGIRVGTDGEPALPPFDFIVPVDVSDSGTTFQIVACSSNPAAGSTSETRNCTTNYWTDSYDPLPAPAVTPNPPVSVGFGTLSLGGTGSVSLANNGVYTDHLELQVDPSLTQAQLDWLFDHLVYFDEQGNAYTNDVLDQGIGILPLDEATYVSPQDQKHHTKYGTGNAVSASLAPNQQLFFYTTLSETRKLGITVIYDSSDTCTGYIANNGSQSATCSARFPGPPSINPQATVTGYAWKPDSASVTGTEAGQQEQRLVQMQVQTAITDTAANCGAVLSPLAMAPSGAEGAQRPPNYVIDDFDWTRRFPDGLYYVLGTGFGNCDLSGAAPFCEQTNGGQGYVGYIPHYLADGVGGTLNGGSNSGPEVTAMDLADEYELGGVGTAVQNALVFFDGCGYGHRYEEPNVNTPLGTRMQLPAAPKGWTKLVYTIKNSLGRAVVFGKECCASWYQPNQQTGMNEPPVELDDGFGMFVPAGGEATYQTLFNDEATVVYDAATGEPLFKLRLNADDPKVYGCNDAAASALVSGSGANITLDLGSQDAGASSCQRIGPCPIGMTAAQSGSLVTCTAEHSTFLFGLDDWRRELVVSPDTVQLRAWGGTGLGGKYGVAGVGGFALTVVKPSDLPSALYAYVGRQGVEISDGGSSSILTSVPLSLTGSDTAESTKVPSDIGVLLVAGGAGGGPAGVGNGGVAVADSRSLPGFAASAAGTDGLCSGTGGNADGQGSGGRNGGAGVGGTSDTNTGWDESGAIIPPNIAPLTWDAGHGPHGNYAAGGGGFGGGSHPKDCGGGGSGGGGGSWAKGNTAFDATAPTSSTPPASPADLNGAIQFAYLQPPCTVMSAGGTDVVRCTYGTVSPLDLSAVIKSLFGSGVSNDLPIYLEAWGGGGGHGQGLHSPGGTGGYARTSQTLATLSQIAPGLTLHIYAGLAGANGTGGKEPGRGGASTLVLTSKDLPDIGASNTVTNPRNQGALLIAGGGGGSGSTPSNSNLQSGSGGQGGVAIASLDGDASCGGFGGGINVLKPADFDGGGGGNGGDGGGAVPCGSSRTGAGGSAGNNGGADGNAGVGGFGGIGQSFGTYGAPWVDSGIDVWTAGNGAGSTNLGGSGGGGFGGGGAGGRNPSGANNPSGGGGGGGGSWARQSTVDDSGAPIVGSNSPGTDGNGLVSITFDICAVEPQSSYCQSGAGIGAVQPQALMVSEPDDSLDVILLGSSNFDPSQLDLQRFLLNYSGSGPLEIFDPCDLNGDGFLDLEIHFQGNPGIDLKGKVQCVQGALRDGTPVRACATATTRDSTLCHADSCVAGKCVAAPTGHADDDGCAIGPGPEPRANAVLLPLLLLGFLLLRTRRRRSSDGQQGL